MSPKSLQELDLKDEVIPPLAFDDMPEFGVFTPPPQPGIGYKFQLPDMTSVYETFEDQNGTHVRVVFDRDHALLIQSSPGGKANGETYQTQITTKARPRGKDKSVEVSDVDYLLKAIKGAEMKTRPTSLKAYVEALQGLSNKIFTADLSYSWTCSESRDIYKTVDGAVVKQEGIKGCGRKFYQDTRTQKPEQKIGRGADGLYPYELACSCGATVRAFANLDNIRA